MGFLSGLFEFRRVLQWRNSVVDLHGVEIALLDCDSVAQVGNRHLTCFSCFHFLFSIKLFYIIPADHELGGDRELVGAQAHCVLGGLE